MQFMQFFQKIFHSSFSLIPKIRLYLDLGTTNTRIAIENKGLILNEPTCIGLNKQTNQYIFYGHEAKTIIGKTPDFIKIIKPLSNGVIIDFDGTVALLKHFIDKAVHPYLANYRVIKPTISVTATVPICATEIEKKAVIECLQKAGCSEIIIINKTLATATGSGADINSHTPCLTVDLGGGLIEMGIVSGGGVIAYRVIKNAGEVMNKLVMNYAYLKNGIILGESTCEDLKIRLLRFNQENTALAVRGKSLENGLPKSIKMTTNDINEALLTSFNQITDMIKEIVEFVQPEIVEEIYKNGIYLSGNLAKAPNINDFFQKELNINTNLVETFGDTTITGLSKLGQNRELLFQLNESF